MCFNCCKALFAKIVYIALIIVVFVAGLLPTFDIYTSMSDVRIKNFRDAEPYTLSMGTTVAATLKSDIFGIPYEQVNYIKEYKCITKLTHAPYIVYKAVENFTVAIDGVVDGQNTKVDAEVRCADKGLFEDNDLDTVYYLTAGFGYGGLALAAILILAVLFCCNGFCSCSCCREGTKEENAALLSV